MTRIIYNLNARNLRAEKRRGLAKIDVLPIETAQSLCLHESEVRNAISRERALSDDRPPQICSECGKERIVEVYVKNFWRPEELEKLRQFPNFRELPLQ